MFRLRPGQAGSPAQASSSEDFGDLDVAGALSVEFIEAGRGSSPLLRKGAANTTQRQLLASPFASFLSTLQGINQGTFNLIPVPIFLSQHKALRLVDPGLGRELVLGDSLHVDIVSYLLRSLPRRTRAYLREPETNLVLGRLHGVGSVADVASDIDRVVTADWGRRVSCRVYGGWGESALVPGAEARGLVAPGGCE